jgi:hypothetical protein
MERKEILDKIKEKTGKTEVEILEQAKSKMNELNGMITEDGALSLIAHDNGIKLETKSNVPDTEKETDENAIEGMEESEPEEVESISPKSGEEELSLEDLGKKFIKAPKVGEEIQFILDKIVKSKNIDAVDKNGKKFKTNLTSVDYKIVFISNYGEELAIHSWEAIGKVTGICKKLGKIKGVELKIKHIADGMKEKNVETYKVQTKINDEWKELDRKTGEWK